MTRIVLFGAGASYGCRDVFPRNPPLGNHLFPALQRLYPGWRSIPDEAVELFEDNFEEGMAKVIEKYGMAVGPLMQEMAIFFSIFSIPTQNQNLYVDLIRNLVDRNDILWSTLNYECLLELAGAKLGKRIGYFTEPAEAQSNVLPVWKLHGSCNFKVTGLEATRGVSYSGTGVTFGGGIEPIDPGAVRAYYSGNTALYPAMCLYAEGKPISMSPNQILESQERWAEHVIASEKILVIGVLPNIEDDHIWNVLSKTEAELGYIGSQQPFSDWIATSRQGKGYTYLGRTWGEAKQEVINFISE